MCCYSQTMEIIKGVMMVSQNEARLAAKLVKREKELTTPRKEHFKRGKHLADVELLLGRKNDELEQLRALVRELLTAVELWRKYYDNASPVVMMDFEKGMDRILGELGQVVGNAT